MKRTFIAVKVKTDKNFNNAFDLLRKGLAEEKIRWIEDDNLHITIAFLGDTEEKSVNSIKSALQKELTGSGKIEFGLKSFGVFRNFRDPRVIFANIENPGKLKETFDKVKSILEELGIRIEEREFTPHLTIGRIKFLNDLNNLRELVQKFDNIKFQDITVSELIFYESNLQSSGPVYKPLEIINLQTRD